MAHYLDETVERLPIPLLPATPRWVDLYWWAWRNVLDQMPGLRVAIARGDLWTAMDDALGGRRRQEAREAPEQLAAHRLDQLADTTAQGSVPSLARSLEAIVLVLGTIIGLEVHEADNHIIWRLRHPPPIGIGRLPLGESTISLLAEGELGGGVSVVVETTAPFGLEIETEFTTFNEQVPAGRTRYLLTYLDRTDVRVE